MEHPVPQVAGTTETCAAARIASRRKVFVMQQEDYNLTEPHFNLWAAALAARVLKLSQLVAWADREIMRLDTPPLWLIELSLATDDAGFGKAWQAVPEEITTQPINGPDPRMIQLGFLYLEYQAGKLSIEELLRRAGYEADPPSSGLPDPEAFHYLLNEIEGTEPMMRSDRPLADRVRELFKPLAEKACVALSYLQTIRMAE